MGIEQSTHQRTMIVTDGEGGNHLGNFQTGKDYESHKRRQSEDPAMELPHLTTSHKPRER